MSLTLTSIVMMVLIIIINTVWRKTESFVDSENNSENDSEGGNDALDKVDSMNDKLDDLVEKETETRTFCKLLRHDSSNQAQVDKLIEHRNKQFEENWRKQNKMLSQIKKKIIEVKSGKTDSDFMKFNTGRNKKRVEMEKRKKLVDVAKKMIKRPPVVNLTLQNNT
tara:strand:+ start:201 stop:698 length:498 start_codon:yes stop_codon:yes gene_type:complete